MTAKSVPQFSPTIAIITGVGLVLLSPAVNQMGSKPKIAIALGAIGASIIALAIIWIAAVWLWHRVETPPAETEKVETTPPRAERLSDEDTRPTKTEREEQKERRPASKVKVEEPTFRERIETVTFSLGGGGLHVGYSLSALEKGPVEPFNFGGSKPVRVYAENGKLYADVAVYGGPNRAPIEVKHNEFVVRPPNWDRNSSHTALEIVNQSQVPIFQLIYKTPSHIVFNGIFPYPGGLILANDQGMLINPTLPTTFRLKRIFKYPSWKYPGQYDN